MGSQRLKDNQNSDIIKEMHKKFKIEKEQLAQTISRLQAEQEVQRKNNSASLEKYKLENEKKILDLGDVYKRKLVVEYEKYGKLDQSSSDSKAKNLKKIESLEQKIQEKVQEIKEEFQVKLKNY